MNNLKKDITCPVMYEQYSNERDRKPKVLKCGHCISEEAIDGLLA